MSTLDGAAGAASNLAALNLSLNCWLHILSREPGELHGDSANLAVGLRGGRFGGESKKERGISSSWAERTSWRLHFQRLQVRGGVRLVVGQGRTRFTGHHGSAQIQLKSGLTNSE